jgi:hypothetical protein
MEILKSKLIFAPWYLGAALTALCQAPIRLRRSTYLSGKEVGSGDHYKEQDGQVLRLQWQRTCRVSLRAAVAHWQLLTN